MHLQKPEFLLFGSQVMLFCKRLVSDIETPTWFFMWMSTWEGGTGKRLPIAFLLESCKKPQASCQANSFLTHCQKKKPQEPTQTSWPQEKGLKQSAPTHAHHTHCTPMHLGIRADQSTMFFGTDFEKCAIWQGSVEKPAVKVFVGRKVRTIAFWQSVRNQLERDQVQRALEKASGSCILTSNNHPYLWGWKFVHNSSPRLYCIDLAEAYVTREKVSSRISQGKVWFAFAQRMFAWETFVGKGKTGKESRY